MMMRSSDAAYVHLSVISTDIVSFQDSGQDMFANVDVQRDSVWDIFFRGQSGMLICPF